MVFLRIGMIWLFRGENTYQVATDVRVYEKYRRKKKEGSPNKLIVSHLKENRHLQNIGLINYELRMRPHQ
ncbi:hypothetical protein SAMN05428949_5631 [Chitinophaga sp. YR627]|nr:hypothetical protein SAMN05428949_5631 [Chitinophaga sp. YR627]